MNNDKLDYLVDRFSRWSNCEEYHTDELHAHYPLAEHENFDDEALKQQLIQWHKDLTLELIGSDVDAPEYPAPVDEMSQLMKQWYFNRNQLRAELRKKLKQL